MKAKQNVPSIKIRRSTIRDIDTLVQQRHYMFHELRHPTPGQHAIGDRAYRKWVIEMIRKRRFVGFLATTPDGKIVGGGCVWLRQVHPFPGSSATYAPYILSMYTDPDYRGLSIATKIVSEAMDWSNEKGFKTIALHASHLGRGVYKKLGFKRTWEMRATPGRRKKLSGLRRGKRK